MTVLVAVSGGSDSVALVRALYALKTEGAGRLAAAHFNHRLRGEAADADEAFVVELCAGLGVRCEVGRAGWDLRSAAAGSNLEAAARKARYRFLRAAAGRLGARYVATAHTADDQAETVLHRVLRGTGIAGLAGMARARPLGEGTAVVRPLLDFDRSVLAAYLTDLGQPWRHDATNDDLGRTRNRIRHELLPQLARDFNPGVRKALLRLGTLAGEAQALIDALAVDLLGKYTRESAIGLEIDVGPLALQPSLLVREVFVAAWRARQWPMQAMGYREWKLLEELVAESSTAKAGLVRKRVLPGGVLAVCRPGRLRLTREASDG